MGVKSNTIYLENPMVWCIDGNATAVGPDVNGILQISMDDSPALIVSNGAVVKGIHLKWMDGTDALFKTNEEVLLVIRAEDGGSFTIVNESLDVVNVNDRISVSSGKNASIGPNKVQIWWQYNGVEWRWYVPDWNVQSATDIPYVPGDGTNWVDPDPENVQEAIDRMAERIATLALGLGAPIG